MDAQTLIQDAKARILKDGKLQPTLLVEFAGKESTLDMQFENMPFSDTHERQKAFFALGKVLGKSYPAEEIRQLVLIMEMWVSFEDIDGQVYAESFPDPDRKEMLVMQTLTTDKATRTLTQHMHLVEMLRDGSGALVDLLPHNDEIQEAHSKLLVAFIAGFEAAKLPADELQRMVRKVKAMRDYRR